MSDTDIPAIECDQLRVAYGDTVAVDELSLSVPAGTVYGFLGPNGAGKTTTMEVLATLRTPTAGSAAVAGHPVTDRTTVRRAVGYLPEALPIHGTLTGREQLRYAADLNGLDADTASERIEAYARRFDLAAALDRSIAGYSTGMRQKLAFIQTILPAPEVVLLDEPTSGLDPQSARTMKDVLETLAADGTTVFLSSHILSVVAELADTVGVLDDGELIAEGDPDALAARADGNEDLEATFLSLTTDEGATTGVDG